MKPAAGGRRRHRGATLISHPTGRGARLCSPWDTPWPAPRRSSGAPRSSRRSTARSRSSSGAAPAAVELVGEPGIGKTRLLAELAARADARGQLVLVGLASSSSATCRSGCSSTRSTSTSQALEPRAARELDDDVRAELAPGASLACRGGARAGDGARRRALPQPTAPCASCSSCWRRRKPLVLVLDDLHWADSGVGRAARRAAAPAAGRAGAARARRCARASCRSGSRRARAGAPRRRADPRSSSAPLTRGEAASCSASASASPHADGLYEESGGNPFYLEQLARSPRAGGRGRAAAAGVALGGVEVPPRSPRRWPRSSRCCRRRRRRVLEGAAVAGDPFEPELAAAAAGVRRGGGARRARRAAARSTSSARPTCRGGSASATRSCAGRSTRPRPAAGGSAPTSACAAALAARGAPAAARAHHVERSARQGDARRGRRPARGGRGRRAARARERRALVRRRAAAAARRRAGRGAGRAAARRARARWPRPASSREATRRCSRASSSLPPTDGARCACGSSAACAGVEHLLGRHEQAHARLESALAALAEPRLARGGRAA